MKKQCTICRINNCYLEEGEDVSQCPINKFLALFGGKRDLIVLLSLEQPQRFGQLKKIIVDISEKMLIQTLHKLEDQGYVAKQKTTGKILQSLYYLTPLGEKILTLGEQMADIGKTL